MLSLELFPFLGLKSSLNTCSPEDYQALEGSTIESKHVQSASIISTMQATSKLPLPRAHDRHGLEEITSGIKRPPMPLGVKSRQPDSCHQKRCDFWGSWWVNEEE